ncbi:unnamed protein product [Dovyalis caffra]|uniref:STICHEL DnaA-N-like alpha-beta domain-containing protein n=1 Tax=Dovyalis caffra TaxID=77055 RepID=A0AAV1S3D0_9ROSI|nr:unnamed protein product [Dovyalis caffra]
MQSAAVVFVLITVDASTIPISISSRCQKFFFPRLKDADVMLKLAGIVVQEDIGIEEEALKLIIMKAEGSLREAEHLLDQLNLPGLRITSSMVQQFVGLVPLNKLINLLTIALSGDTEKTLLSTTRELIATGVEAQTLAFQLATLIADLLSEASATTPNYSTLVGPSSEKKRLLTTNVQPERLCHTLKILIDAKKQPRSSIDNITQIYAALLQIAPQNNSSGTSSGFSLPNGIIIPTGETTQLENHHCMSKTSEHSTVDRISIKTFSKSKQSRTVECIEKTMKCRGIDVDEGLNLARWTDMEETWLHILDNIQSIDMKEFLSSHVKLASVTLTCAANAIVHLVFKTPEDKLAAQISEESISEALKSSIGCPVIINMSLEPLDMGFVQECNASNNKSKLEESNYSMQMQQKLFLPELVDVTNPRVRMHQNKHVKPASPSDNKPRPTELKDSMSISQEEDGSPTREAKLTRCLRGQMSPFFGLIMQDNQLEASTSAATNSLIRDQGKANTSHVMITERPKHRWLSLSSIQQSDASVQPYSQDILFENANIDRESRTNKNPKLQKDSSKVHKELHLQERAKSMDGEVEINPLFSHVMINPVLFLQAIIPLLELQGVTRPKSGLNKDAAKKKIQNDNIPTCKIIKISKLKTDYRPFEAKRKLCDSYDIFFADKRLVPLLPKMLGKRFFKKKKILVTLDLKHHNWKEQMDKTCGSALLYLRSGTFSVVKIGRISMSREEIANNMMAAVNGIEEIVPRKWGVIRSFHLKLIDSLALPVYLEEDGVVAQEEEKEKVKKGEVGGKKKGRIHVVRYMDDNNDNEDGQVVDEDELWSDGEEDIDNDDDDFEKGSGELLNKERKKGDNKGKDEEEEEEEEERKEGDNKGYMSYELLNKTRKKGDNKEKDEEEEEVVDEDKDELGSDGEEDLDNDEDDFENGSGELLNKKRKKGDNKEKDEEVEEKVVDEDDLGSDGEKDLENDDDYFEKGCGELLNKKRKKGENEGNDEEEEKRKKGDNEGCTGLDIWIIIMIMLMVGLLMRMN